MPLGIIGRRADPQVAAVAERLRERGEEPVVLDLSRFPAASQLSVRDGVPSARGLEVGDVGAWYVRTLPLPLPFLTADRTEYAAGRERRSFVAGFVAGLADAGAVLVNPPATMAQHFRKLEQLDTLRAVGVPVPTTLATNDSEAVAAFARELDGAVVYKPLAGGALCRRLAPTDLAPERLALLAWAPVLFQEEVPGRNLRVYVVAGEEAATYEIRSDELDYRGSETEVVAASLTDDEGKVCRRAAEACGMTLAGIDVRRRPDGTFAVLECNPSPMFAAIERRTGATPVSAAIAAALVFLTG